jgi:ribosome-associated heat shock protein Hsp15
MREGEQRLDKWLWFARVAKTRSQAARLVADGYVRVNGTRVTKAARPVAAGDVLTLALTREVRILRVRGPGERRGAYVDACRLFDELAMTSPATPALAMPRGSD